MEDTLNAYDGALLFVSHDRHFIGLMAERIWSLEDGVVRLFEGGFEDWMRANHPPASELVSRRARARHRRRERETKMRERDAQPTDSISQIDYESLIQKLEAEVTKIERRLQRASERQDVEAIARLGKKHAQAQTELEQAWEDWADA